MFIEKIIDGFEIHTANPTGGKAGKGRNKTSTIQLRHVHKDGSYTILKQVRYEIAGGLSAKLKAIEKIKKSQH